MNLAKSCVFGNNNNNQTLMLLT